MRKEQAMKVSTCLRRLRRDYETTEQMRSTILRRYERLTIHSSTNACRGCSHLKDPQLRLFTNRSLIKTILSSTCAWRYCSQLKISHTTVHWPLRLMERLCLYQRLQPCPRTLEDVDEPKKAAEKTHQPIVTTDETILSARALEGRWEIETVFYFTLNDSKARRLTLWSMFTIERLERDCRCRVRLERASNKAQSEDSHADCFSRKSPIGIFARKASFTAWMRSKCGRSLAGSAWSIPGRVWGFGPSKSVDYPSKKLTFTSLSSVGTRIRHRRLKIMLRIVLAVKVPF